MMSDRDAVRRAIWLAVLLAAIIVVVYAAVAYGFALQDSEV